MSAFESPRISAHSIRRADPESAPTVKPGASREHVLGQRFSSQFREMAGQQVDPGAIKINSHGSAPAEGVRQASRIAQVRGGAADLAIDVRNSAAEAAQKFMTRATYDRVGGLVQGGVTKALGGKPIAQAIGSAVADSVGTQAANLASKGLGGLGGKLLGFASQHLSGVASHFSGLASKAIGLASGIGGKIAGVASSVLGHSVGGMASSALGVVGKALGVLLPGGAVVGAVAAFAPQIAKVATDVVKKVGNFFKKLF